jgi:glucose-1-phosphate thymidylyltransferase
VLIMKGILLAGGTGSRLYPMTIAVVKQLLPIYDKPLIYYPFCTLLEAGVTEFLIICTQKDQPSYEKLFGHGEKLGVSIQYTIQDKPNGLSEAFILGEKFIDKDSVWLILGDNIFLGDNLATVLETAESTNKGGTVYAYKVKDPERYGVIEFTKDNKVISIEEKPTNPRSNYAQVGLYYFNNEVIEVAKNQKPSARGELEITDISNYYLSKGTLDVVPLPAGTTWLDTGTYMSLYDAGDFVRVIQERQDILIGSPELIAYRKGLINKEILLEHGENMKKTEYGQYLIRVAKE